MGVVYASRASMWLVVGDVLQRQYTQLMPSVGGEVDMDRLVAAIDRVYEEGPDGSVLDLLIADSLAQLEKQKMIPRRGKPWPSRS